MRYFLTRGLGLLMPFARICGECGDVKMVKNKKKAEGVLCFDCSILINMKNLQQKVKKPKAIKIKKPKIKKEKKIMSESKIPLESQISLGNPITKRDEKKYPKSTPEQDTAMIRSWLKKNKVKAA